MLLHTPWDVFSCTNQLIVNTFIMVQKTCYDGEHGGKKLNSNIDWNTKTAVLLLFKNKIFYYCYHYKSSSSTWKKISFTARGYHCYQKFWRPKENEKLICLHEPGNVFDRFAVKTLSEHGKIVGHLLKKF